MTRREAYHKMAVAVMRCDVPREWAVEVALSLVKREFYQGRKLARQREYDWGKKWKPILAKACGE